MYHIISNRTSCERAQLHIIPDSYPELKAQAARAKLTPLPSPSSPSTPLTKKELWAGVGLDDEVSEMSVLQSRSVGCDRAGGGGGPHVREHQPWGQIAFTTGAEEGNQKERRKRKEKKVIIETGVGNALMDRRRLWTSPWGPVSISHLWNWSTACPGRRTRRPSPGARASLQIRPATNGSPQINSCQVRAMLSLARS